MLAACNTASAPPPSNARIVKIGLIYRLVGEQIGPGQGARNSGEVALRQAHATNPVPGYRLQLDARNAEEPAEGAAQAAQLAADPQVAGVLGAPSPSRSPGV